MIPSSRSGFCGASSLLEEPKGPILVDHDEQAQQENDMTGLTCPVSYARPEGNGSLDERLRDGLGSADKSLHRVAEVLVPAELRSLEQ